MVLEVRGTVYRGSHGSIHIVSIGGKAAKPAGQHRQPFAFFRKALAEHRAGKCNDRGIAGIDKGDYKGAIQWLGKALRRDPDYVPAHINLGVCHARRGDGDAAVLDLERAIQIAPSHANAHYNLGILLARLGRYDLSIGEFGKILENDALDAEALFNRGNVYGLKREYGTALAHYEAVLALDPEHKVALRNRDAVALFLAERKKKASERNE